MYGYTIEKSTGNVIDHWKAEERPQNTDTYQYVACLLEERPEKYVAPDSDETVADRLVRARVQKLAEDSLIADGTCELVEGKLKKKKVV